MIRNAEMNDIGSIQFLWSQMSELHQGYDETFTLESNAVDVYKDYALQVINDQNKLSIVFVYREVIGFLFAETYSLPPVYKTGKIGLITEISVNNKYQRIGVGTELVKYSEKWFTGLGINIIECQVSLKNPISTDFWSKKGFIEHSLLSRKLIN